MKTLYSILLSLLLVAMAAVGVYSLVDVDATTSKTENRDLAKKPAFSIAGLFDGSYISSLEKYYSDTFPGRDALLSANKSLNGFYHFSGGGDSNLLVVDFQGGVEQGGQALNPDHATDAEDTPEATDSDTELPPEEIPVSTDEPDEPETPETPETTTPDEEEESHGEYTTAGSIIIQGDNAMDIPTASNDIIDSYAQAVNNLSEALGKDVRTISLVTPNSGQFYSDKEFHTGIHDQKAMIERCYSGMNDDIVTVDAYTPLAAHKDEYLFFRTDHHWTQLGAYYAYTAFCEAAGFEAVPLEKFETGVYENFVGSMYTYTSAYPQSEALKNNPDTLTYYLPIVETHARYYADADFANSTAYPVSVVYRGITEEETNKYMCFLGGDHPGMTIECDVPGGKTCLVLKESYGNAFIPFLTSHYSKIYVIDPREFNQDGKPSLDLTELVKEYPIDDLIVINYPFMINNKTYVNWLNRLVGKGT